MAPQPKLKLALYWAASCGGCEIAVVELREKLLVVDEVAEILFWPVAVDVKYKDVEAMPDKNIDVCLFNGAVRTSENEHLAHLMRKKSKVLVAFGSCATEGCIPGLSNLHTRQEIFDNSYQETSSTENPQHLRPQTATSVAEGTLHLPLFYDTLKTLDQTVPVDYYLPGCPPESPRIWDALQAIISGELPPRGTVIGSDTTVCDECPRQRNVKKIKEFKRTWEIIPDPELCLLEQGLLCCGLATRAGCGALCPAVNSPCIGCYGPNNGVEDYGTRLLSAVASVIDSDNPREIDEIIRQGIPDPVGSFYRFSLAGGLLRRGKRQTNGNGGPAKHERVS